MQRLAKPKDSRDHRVIAIPLGSGNGKTHLLREAPNLLDALGIYITFNLSQNLVLDVQRPQETILLGILLRLEKIPNQSCHSFFNLPEDQALLSVGTSKIEELRGFVVDQLVRLQKDFVIGVDEAMELAGKQTTQNGIGDSTATNGIEGDVQTIQLMLSELWEVANEFYQRTKRMCTVLITSLKEEPRQQ